MRIAALLLLLLYTWSSQTQVLPPTLCGDKEWDDSATAAFSAYAQDVRMRWSTLSAQRNFSSVRAVTNPQFARSLHSSKQQCLVELIYRKKRNRVRIGRWFKVGAIGNLLIISSTATRILVHTQAHGSCDNLKGRAEILYIVLNYMVTRTRLASSITHDFRFWYVWLLPENISLAINQSPHFPQHPPSGMI